MISAINPILPFSQNGYFHTHTNSPGILFFGLKIEIDDLRITNSI